MADAFLDRHPLLAISACTAVSQTDWLNHQNLRLNKMFAPISKDSVALDGLGTAIAIHNAKETSHENRLDTRKTSPKQACQAAVYRILDIRHDPHDNLGRMLGWTS